MINYTMAILQILKAPDEFLFKVSKPVTEFDDSLWQLLDDMGQTLDKSKGLGIAGVQIGRLLRVCIVLTKEGKVELINPVILASDKLKSGEEGCLSVPKIQSRIKRFHDIKVRAQDRHGKTFEKDFSGLSAVCVQHEIDHLDGKLYVDLVEDGLRDVSEKEEQENTIDA